MSETPTLDSVANPVSMPYQAFKLETATVNPLELKVFSVSCKNCDKPPFVISGLLLSIDIDDNADLAVTCRCGEQYSISEQSKANQEAYKELQKLQQNS